MSILHPVLFILPIPLFWLVLWLRGRPGFSRRFGGALIAASLLGLIGGQAVALLPGAGAVGDDGMDVRLPAPPRGAFEGEPEEYLVRFLTFSLTVEGEATLLAHATANAPSGTEVRLVADPPGAGPVELRVTAKPAWNGGVRVEFEVRHGHGNHAGSRSRSAGEDGPVSVDRIGTSAARPWCAALPWSRVSGPLTVLFVDPVPADAAPEIVPYRETWEGGERASTLEALSEESGIPHRRSRGFEGLLASISPFAGLMLVLLCAGCVLTPRRAGLGLLLFVASVPFLLVGLDRVALEVHLGRAAEGNVAAAARAAESVFYGETGREALREVGGEGTKPMTAEAPAGAIRRNLLTAEEWNTSCVDYRIKRPFFSVLS